MNCTWFLRSIPLHEGFRNGPYNLSCDISVCYFCFPPFKCPSTVIRLMKFLTQLTAVLQFGSLVSCHNFRSLCFCFNSWSKPGSSGFTSEILLVDNRYTDAIEAVNSRPALSASTPVLIYNLGDIKSEERLWNLSQSSYFSMGSERFLILTWSSMWNNIDKWSESRILETATLESLIFWWTIMSSMSPFTSGE
jgi:hypothetical protein